MPRSFHFAGLALIFISFVLMVLVSISTPTLNSMDFARVQNLIPGNFFEELRFGIWDACTFNEDGSHSCPPAGHGYSAQILYVDPSGGRGVIVEPSWTRGLAVHPVAAGLTLVALILSIFSRITVAFFASIATGLAAFLTFVAFLIDVALYAHIKHDVNSLNTPYFKITTAPAFWLTFVSFILLSFAAVTIWLGRRRDLRTGTASYPMSPTSSSWRNKFMA